ncbi:class Ib ribonucleoside-diphosphate reductase assembly flavoprotein NrdI [uncultured Roseibium sp.]|uniref:class Ib ribonucleoside-diphosphate reductase assembly flavoprotein NrdI n=1 Tax=uncultured Roseibium sp. TaxID=1936171 RepID=UPI0026357259|nr:class Ib ribonucleoside-diphosphate reductase assembly flavoprotein NrdI [uncultured Roseibium sp.]
MTRLVYFSSASGNTHRFIEKLGNPALRIPRNRSETLPVVHAPFLLILPTFSDGEGQGAVPGQVIRFLNDAANRSFLKGVIASGNRNFGAYFAYAGDVVSKKCGVPLLYRFELAGTETDLHRVQHGMTEFWKRQS